MNVIKVNVDFTNRKITKTGVDLTSGDYNSTKMVFEFDRNDGIKIFEMKNPNGDVIFLSTIKNNELILTAKDENDNYSTLFTESGDYIYEISLYKDNSKLASASDYLVVRQEQIIIADSLVEPYLPVFDEMVNELQDSLVQVDNLNIDANKEDNITTVEITDKSGNTKSVEILDGVDGKDGVDGEDYVITENDYRAIADIVVNENDFVSDANYVHTDNNYTTAEKTKLSGLENYDDTNLVNQINRKQDTLTAGENITIENNVISSTGGSGVSDYEDILNKPQINSVELIGDKSLDDLGINTIPDGFKFLNISDYYDEDEAKVTWANLYDALGDDGFGFVMFDIAVTISSSSDSVTVTKGCISTIGTKKSSSIFRQILMQFVDDGISCKIQVSNLFGWNVTLKRDIDTSSTKVVAGDNGSFSDTLNAKKQEIFDYLYAGKKVALVCRIVGASGEPSGVYLSTTFNKVSNTQYTVGFGITASQGAVCGYDNNNYVRTIAPNLYRCYDTTFNVSGTTVTGVGSAAWASGSTFGYLDAVGGYNSGYFTPTYKSHPISKGYLDNSLSNIAPMYDATSTYSVGDYVFYNNVLYVCNTAIETAEAFDSTKWTQTTIVEIIGNLESLLGAI